MLIVDNGLYIPYVKSSRYHTEEEIKERNELYYSVYKAAEKAFKDEYGMDSSTYGWPKQLKMSKRGNTFSISSGFAETDLTVRLDAETIEPLSISDILGENWTYYASEDVKNAAVICLVDYNTMSDFKAVSFTDEDVLTVWIMYTKEGNVWGSDCLNIPLNEVNMKYIGGYTDF